MVSMTKVQQQEGILLTENDIDDPEFPMKLSEIAQLLSISHALLVGAIYSGSIKEPVQVEGRNGHQYIRRKYILMIQQQLKQAGLRTFAKIALPPKKKESKKDMAMQVQEGTEVWTDQQAADYLNRTIATIEGAGRSGRIKGDRNARTMESVMQYKQETQGTLEPGPNFSRYLPQAEESTISETEGKEVAQPTPVVLLTDEGSPEEQEQVIVEITAIIETEQPQEEHLPSSMQYASSSPAEPVRHTPTKAKHEFYLMQRALQFAYESLSASEQSSMPTSVKRVEAPVVWDVTFFDQNTGQEMVKTILYTGRSYFILENEERKGE